MSISSYYRPPTKLWEGNVFTSVCHSVHGVCLVPSNFWGGEYTRVGIPEGDGVRTPEGVG